MSYSLTLYGLPPGLWTKAPDDPARMQAFVEAAAEMLGKLDFEPGESTLFLEAAEEATGVELLPLLEGPIGEGQPDDVYAFGGLEVEELSEGLSALEKFLAETGPETPGVEPLCQRFELTPQRFLDLLVQLKNLLAKAREQGNSVVTLYNG